MSKRVIIVGAGPGGLAAAMLLSQAGLDVTVLERQSRVGGRTSTLDAGNYRFDLGPTFFLYPRILNEIFAATGHDLFNEVPMHRLDPQYRLVFGQGGELNATADVERMEQEIMRLSPGDAGRFEKFMADNRKKLAKFAPILERPFYGIKDLIKADTLAALPQLRPWRSLHQDVGRHFSDPRLKLAFTFQGKYLGMSPFQCPSLFSILSFLEYEHGVWHPRGGCGAVSRKMADIARKLGADIRLDESVKELRFSGRRVNGVVTDQASYDCDALVINADFAHAMQSLVPDNLRRRWSNRKLSRKRYSCSTFMMYIGLNRDSVDLPHHTIYLSENYRQNLDDIEQHRIPDDPSIYVQNACQTDPSLATPGHSTLYVLAPVPHQSSRIDWRDQSNRFRKRVLKQLERLGVNDLERHIQFEKILTPADWERQGIYRGATFNLSHCLTQMLHMRPQNRFEELDSVYLVGGGTHPGSGLPTIYSSARIASDTLLEDFGVSTESSARESKSGVNLLTPSMDGRAVSSGAV